MLRIVALSVWFSLATAALADTVYVRPPGTPADAQPTPYEDVNVTGVTDGQITFVTIGGTTISKDMTTVTGLMLNDEPLFNDAQTDLQANRPERAVDKLQQTIEKTDKPWLKDYCQPILLQAANQAGRFDISSRTYVDLLVKGADVADKDRPTVPANGSNYLDDAATAVAGAADTPNLPRPQLRQILSFLLEIDLARQDQNGIDSVKQRLVDAGGNPSDPTTAGALADAKLADARDALDKNQFDQAIALIDASRSAFTDPARQSDALFIQAQAKGGLAQAANDANAWRDAAIAYMRVVADFKDTPGAPHVADSLFATAGILEKLNQPDKAREIYLSITHDYPNAPASAPAADAVRRLGGSAGAN
ncbi:MAG: hypothetical protein ABSG31_14415 [Tepidisphaeraceae bacterium]|jgi:TolA-binding protein